MITVHNGGDKNSNLQQQPRQLLLLQPTLYHHHHHRHHTLQQLNYRKRSSSICMYNTVNNNNSNNNSCIRLLNPLLSDYQHRTMKQTKRNGRCRITKQYTTILSSLPSNWMMMITNNNNSNSADSPITISTATASSLSLSAAAFCNHPMMMATATAIRIWSFLPDFTEHPKPKRKVTIVPVVPTPFSGGGSDGRDDDDDGKKRVTPTTNDDTDADADTSLEQEITFRHDFIAGGVAGSASVIVGHPFDTIKVRLQTMTTTAASSGSILSTISEFGGFTSLFRGMTAPLGAAAIINAIVFGSYGFSSRLYDKYLWNGGGDSSIISNTTTTNSTLMDGTTTTTPTTTTSTHDPWQKSFVCGAFAGFVQCFVICPLEHIKCRLQIQVVAVKGPTVSIPKSSSAAAATAAVTTAVTREYYNGPIDAVRKISSKYGVRRLYQGWWSTVLREVPAFGLYFSCYDYLKDVTNTLLVQYWKDDANSSSTDTNCDINNTTTTTAMTSHTWIASAIAGGLSGSLTWAIVYPVDLIKSHIQTRALSTPYSELRMMTIATSLVRQYGISYLFRGLNITLIRALPVNGTIFPVYEFTLKQMTMYQNEFR